MRKRVKVTKFVDPDKPKNPNKLSKPKNSGYVAKPKGINPLAKLKPKTTKDLAKDYTQKYLEKKLKLEQQIQTNVTKNRGPQSKKELAQIKFDIQQVQLSNCSAEEKRQRERERLIKLGAKAPKSHKNYKEFTEDNKRKEAEFQDQLAGFSQAEQTALNCSRIRELKKEKDLKAKGDRRFFNQRTDGLKTSGMKVGKFKDGVAKLSKRDVSMM